MQCDYITSVGQCPKEAIPPGRFCESHSATSNERLIAQYRIANKMLGDSAQRHAQSDQIKSLHGEIALLRALIESRLNQAECDAEVIAAMPAVKDAIVAVEKLVASCHAMDVKLGNLLSKQALMALAGKIIGIIDTHIRPFAGTEATKAEVEDAIELIGTEIVQAIAAQENT